MRHHVALDVAVDVADVVLSLHRMLSERLIAPGEISMSDDTALLPPISEINRQLTIVARQQSRLRTLLRLAVQAREDAKNYGLAITASRHESVQPEEASSC